MNKYALGTLFALILFSCPAGAGETAPDARSAEMDQALSKLEGVSGLHGGNAQDMQQFLGMVQTPEMVQLVERLSAQLGGDPENMDMAAVDEFVRNNITLEDVQKLLGQPVSSEDLHNALNREVTQEQMQQMLQILNQQAGGSK